MHNVQFNPVLRVQKLPFVGLVSFLFALPTFALAQQVRFVEHPQHSLGAPSDLTLGSDGALWSTNLNSRIDRFTSAGVVTEYPIPGHLVPSGITAGPDGALWFTGSDLNTTSAASIGRITTSGTISLFPLTGNHAAQGITSGPDGALWFADSGASEESPLREL